LEILESIACMVREKGDFAGGHRFRYSGIHGRRFVVVEDLERLSASGAACVLVGVFDRSRSNSRMGTLFLRVPLSARNSAEFYREDRKSPKGCPARLYAFAR
jgi:hypothetical protein